MKQASLAAVVPDNILPEVSDLYLAKQREGGQIEVFPPVTISGGGVDECVTPSSPRRRHHGSSRVPSRRPSHYKKVTDETRDLAVREAINSTTSSLRTVARRYEIAPSTLSDWVKQAQEKTSKTRPPGRPVSVLTPDIVEAVGEAVKDHHAGSARQVCFSLHSFCTCPLPETRH